MWVKWDLTFDLTLTEYLFISWNVFYCATKHKRAGRGEKPDIWGEVFDVVRFCGCWGGFVKLWDSSWVDEWLLSMPFLHRCSEHRFCRLAFQSSTRIISWVCSPRNSALTESCKAHKSVVCKRKNFTASRAMKLGHCVGFSSFGVFLPHLKLNILSPSSNHHVVLALAL